MRTIFILGLLAITSLHAQAQIYKWTDANGKVHYSDKDVVGNGSALRVPKGAAVDPDAKTKILQYKNQLDGKRELQQEKAEKEQQQLAEIQAKCSKTRSHLKDFEEVGLVYQVKDGERKYLDHTEKDAQMAQMKQFLKDNCD